jgi:hypothetical protein
MIIGPLWLARWQLSDCRASPKVPSGPSRLGARSINPSGLRIPGDGGTSNRAEDGKTAGNNAGPLAGSQRRLINKAFSRDQVNIVSSAYLGLSTVGMSSARFESNTYSSTSFSLPGSVCLSVSVCGHIDDLPANILSIYSLGKPTEVERYCVPTRLCESYCYWQLGNLKLPIQVLQLKVPLVLRYSLV